MMSYTLSTETDAFTDLPGYKSILKAVLKAQIQHLVEQLAEHTDEETVVLTASTRDGTISHIGSHSGRLFLDYHEDFKSTFLQFCMNYQTLAFQQSEESSNDTRNGQKFCSSVRRKKTLPQIQPFSGPPVYTLSQKPFQHCNLQCTPLDHSLGVKTEKSETQGSVRNDKTNDIANNDASGDNSDQIQSTVTKEPVVEIIRDKEWPFVDMEVLMPAEKNEDKHNAKEDEPGSQKFDRTNSQSKKRKLEEYECDTDRDSKSANLERAMSESYTRQDDPDPPDDTDELHPLSPVIKVEPTWEDECGGVAMDQLEQPAMNSSIPARTNTSWVIEKHTLYGGDGSLYDAGLACARKSRQSINSYTIETKYQAIIELEKGNEKGRIAEVARKFGLPFTTLATWAKNAAKIKEKYEQSEQLQKRTNIKIL